jgi:hypothetical protein
MAKPSENWSERRRIMAPRIASVLYGVIAVISVDLAVSPNERLDYMDAASYILLLGLAMTLTRAFVETVTREAEIGAHLSIKDFGALVRDSLLVMAFPVVTAMLIIGAALATARWTVLLDIVLYFGIAAVFVTGFLSSYVLDRDIRLGLTRGGAWAVLTLALVAVKKLA